MNVAVKDFSQVETKNLGKCVRFSVTLLDDDGEPLWTQAGFLIDTRRNVYPPFSKPSFGKGKRFTTISDRFAEMLSRALGAVPAVGEVLGPPVPAMPKRKWAEPKKLDGGGVVK